jgi:hypothetical protein
MWPHLEQNITNITRDVAVIKASKGFDWLFIDTPPRCAREVARLANGTLSAPAPRRSPARGAGTMNPRPSPGGHGSGPPENAVKVVMPGARAP